MSVSPDLCVIHGGQRADEEDPLACWEYDGSVDCVFAVDLSDRRPSKTLIEYLIDEFGEDATVLAHAYDIERTVVANLHPSEAVAVVRRGVESGTIKGEVWYWVTPVDNPDALGDYGGFTFQTHNEAEKFIRAEYAEHERLRREGYYEDDSTPDLLQIETVVTVKTEVIPVSDGGSET